MKQWTVQDVMTREVISVPPSASYRDVVDRLIEHRVSAVPVTGTEGQVLGIVSEADLLHKVEAVGEPQRPRIVRALRRSAEIREIKEHATTAADLMTAPAITVGPEVSVVSAARRLEDEKVKRMPVVGADGCLLGIVSRRDLLRIHTRTDDDIRADVADNVLRRTLWIDPDAVTVGVDDGTVTLHGQVETRSLARLAVDLVGEVAGVVTVVDQLTWQFDDSELARSRGYQFGTPEHLLRPGGD
ncbi:CBS domain-containing protein [Paractinoplanes rishiriensis]|uniref:CBS domain-containing protein n=1 Tax=Paractinoplanes rishiriensis TaxID=1050105 RepID=A0A919K511_9ACTN|nr:CBS domain-containing protein [Actinoplanes rishiriensis]GIE99437.1 hypothetical protein Ari01nite_69020 [Actinoplanes rishiriensis]